MLPPLRAQVMRPLLLRLRRPIQQTQLPSLLLLLMLTPLNPHRLLLLLQLK